MKAWHDRRDCHHVEVHVTAVPSQMWGMEMPLSLCNALSAIKPLPVGPQRKANRRSKANNVSDRRNPTDAHTGGKVA